MKYTLIVMMVCALSGCLTVQNEAVRTLSYEEAVNAIPIGSSQAKVREVFGKPQSINSRNGEEFWSYVDQQIDWAKALNPLGGSLGTLQSIDTRNFMIWFNRRGRVTRIEQGTFNF